MRKYRLLIICILIVWLFGCAASRLAKQVKMTNVVFFTDTLPPDIEFKILGAELVRGVSVGHLELIVREEAVKLGSNAVRFGGIGTAVGVLKVATDAYVTYLYYDPTPENEKKIVEFFEKNRKAPTCD